jgi:hypothetical protein
MMGGVADVMAALFSRGSGCWNRKAAPALSIWSHLLRKTGVHWSGKCSGSIGISWVFQGYGAKNTSNF